MLIIQNQDPVQSIYYIAACIYYELTHTDVCSPIELYQKTKEKYSMNLQYNRFVLSLNFLYLKDDIVYCDGILEVNHAKNSDQ